MYVETESFVKVVFFYIFDPHIIKWFFFDIISPGSFRKNKNMWNNMHGLKWPKRLLRKILPQRAKTNSLWSSKALACYYKLWCCWEKPCDRSIEPLHQEKTNNFHCHNKVFYIIRQPFLNYIIIISVNKYYTVSM